PLILHLRDFRKTQLKLLLFILIILFMLTNPLTINITQNCNYLDTNTDTTKKISSLEIQTQKTRANPFIVSGYVFLESGANANIGVNISGHILESGEIQTTTTQEKLGGLIGYSLTFGYLLNWNAGDTLVLNATDYSPSIGSYHGSVTVTIPEDTFDLTVNITLFWDSKPMISSPLALNTSKTFENDTVLFEIGAYDDYFITKVQIRINNSKYEMNLKTGNSASGTWEYIHKFPVNGKYLISAMIFDSVQSRLSNQITLNVYKDHIPILVLAANNTQPDLNEGVRFSINVLEDRYLKNITLHIGVETVTPVLDSGDTLNGIYVQDWVFTNSGIFYCYVVAYDLLTGTESNQIAIASNTTAVPPKILTVEANVSTLEVNEIVQFIAKVSDNKEVVNVYLVSEEYNISMTLIAGNTTEGTWRYTWIATLPGIYLFRIYAIDNDRILSGSSSLITIEVLSPDQQAEILGITPSNQRIVIKKGSEVEFSIWLRDDRGISLVYLYVENLPLKLSYYSGSITNGNWTVKRFFDIIGQYEIYFEIRDTGNHIIKSSQQMIVVDDIPKLYTLQTNITSVKRLQGISFQILATDDFNITTVILFIHDQNYNLNKVSGNSTYSLWANSFILQEEGIFTTYAIAFDNNSQSTISNQIDLTVLPDKRPELGVLRSSGIRIKQNQEVAFTVTAYDDTKLNNVKIFIEGQQYSMNKVQGNRTVSIWKYNQIFSQPGEYSVTVTAYDNLNQASDQSNVLIIFVSPEELSSTLLPTTTSAQSKSFPIGFESILTLGIILTLKQRRIRKKRGGEPN
ncbi:MAG: hypothetical protein ACFFCQ_13845, partial [Promethearchaeota archaeon]